MKIYNKHELLVNQLVADGVDFSRDGMMLPHSELSYFSELAKNFGYKEPLLHSRGYGYYEKLRKLYKKMNGI